MANVSALRTCWVQVQMNHGYQLLGHAVLQLLTVKLKQAWQAEMRVRTLGLGDDSNCVDEWMDGWMDGWMGG